MSRFQTTFKTETETQYTLSPSNKFGIHFDKVNKIATVEITVFDRTAPAGQRVQTFATKTFNSVKAAKNFCWDNEYVPAKELVTDGKLISSF
jgi:hypothetical protein